MVVPLPCQPCTSPGMLLIVLGAVLLWWEGFGVGYGAGPACWQHWDEGPGQLGLSERWGRAWHLTHQHPTATNWGTTGHPHFEAETPCCWLGFGGLC